MSHLAGIINSSIPASLLRIYICYFLSATDLDRYTLLTSNKIVEFTPSCVPGGSSVRTSGSVYGGQAQA